MQRFLNGYESNLYLHEFSNRKSIQNRPPVFIPIYQVEELLSDYEVVVEWDKEMIDWD